ncbi:MAG: SUMF1/EgtB/PvdO family nonheme iron enzyme [Kiritimatiellae bacterium]|nr:SUMF1/EgtB/PvdO family nonheme iron enzyme [Kiritimatiellia bacterium]
MKRLMTTIGAAAMACGAHAAGVTIDSVTQRWPWNNKVDITYTVTDGQDVDAGVFCRLVFSANVNGETYVIDGVTNVGASASSGTHTITWNPPSGVKTANCSMTAQLIEADAPSGDDYMIVDIQTGRIWYEGLLASQELSNQRYNTALYKTTNMVFRKIARTADSACPNGYRTGDNANNIGTINGDARNLQTNWITYLDYYIGVFPVTQWQFDELYGSNPSTFKADSEGNNHWYRPVNAIQWYVARRSTVTTNEVVEVIPGNSNTISFLGYLNGKTKAAMGVTGFDLPTKIMGEIAARGGSDKKYPWGDDLNDCADYAVINTNTTLEVGSKLPNDLGIYDMIGNVREWGLDDYLASRKHYAESPDPWTPAYNAATDSTTKNRLFITSAAYNATLQAGSISPAAIYGEQWSKNSAASGMRVSFIVK